MRLVTAVVSHFCAHIVVSHTYLYRIHSFITSLRGSLSTSLNTFSFLILYFLWYSYCSSYIGFVFIVLSSNISFSALKISLQKSSESHLYFLLT